MSREEQLRIQALGAALSRRDWHATEQAYNAIRDEFDRRSQSSDHAPSSLSQGGDAVIEGDAVVIRFPLEAMQSALDGAWGLNVFDRRQKVTDQAEFAKEFCRELNAESENGTTLIHRMADEAFVNMLEGGAFGFDEHEEQSL